MDAANRRFTSWLGIVFGPLFVGGGFLAAFTIEGALFIWLGLAMLAAGIALRTRLPFWFVVTAAFLLFAALTAYTLFWYPGVGWWNYARR